MYSYYYLPTSERVDKNMPIHSLLVICLLCLYSFRNWQTSQPNNAGGIEHCAVYSVISFALNDRDCAISLPFICEMSKCK